MNLSNKGGAGPNVEAALSSPVEPATDRKPIIGGRKPAAKKTGVKYMLKVLIQSWTYLTSNMYALKKIITFTY